MNTLRFSILLAGLLYFSLKPSVVANDVVTLNSGEVITGQLPSRARYQWQVIESAVGDGLHRYNLPGSIGGGAELPESFGIGFCDQCLVMPVNHVGGVAELIRHADGIAGQRQRVGRATVAQSIIRPSFQSGRGRQLCEPGVEGAVAIQRNNRALHFGADD